MIHQIMKSIRFSLITLLSLTAVLQSAPRNTSFKIGVPVSTFQIMLGDRNYQGKNFTPTVGISYFGTSTQRKGGSNDYDYSIKFLLPRVGARMIGARIGDLNYYYVGELFLVMPFVSGSDITNADKTEIKDELDLIGVTLGWGVEYYFSDSFSLGGEITLNWIYHSVEKESTNWDYYDYSSSTEKYNVITTLSATMSQITLNYYFQ